MKKYICGLLYLALSAAVNATTSGDVVVSPENKGVFIDKFFKDYKSSSNPNPSNSELDALFIAEGFNGIRTPIYGTDSLPAHPAAGVVVGSYYTAHVDTILRAKQRNPDLIVFASKKLDGQTSFPAWTKEGSGVFGAQYAILLADYIEYMASQEIAIDVLGVDNERQYNEGNIWASTHKNVVDELQALSVSRGFPMPLIIGHEDFGPNKDNWMANLMNNGWGGRLDIFGTHYYPGSRPLSGLQSDLAWAADREKWHTELHWDNPDPGEDIMKLAEQAIGALWDCTDNGMNGLMWWGYSRTGFKGSLMQQFSVPLIGAYALAVDDVDGSNISTLGKLQTRAFLKGNQLTVYAVNRNSVNTYPNMVFRIDSGRILGDVAALQWTSTNQTSGTASSVIPLNTQSFQFPLPARSISSFTFTFAASGLFAHYPFEGDADDVSSNARHGTKNGSVTYSAGREGFAASFASLSDTVSIPFASFDDWLTTFWLKTASADGPLMDGNELSIGLVASNLVFAIGTNSISSFKPLNDGRWHHVAAERKVADGSMRLYIDGRIEAYGTGTDATLSETDLVLGGFAGMMDEVKFFDRTLQTSDAAYYRSPSVLLGTGGASAEKGPVESFVTLTQSPAGSDYPYIDLIEDDGTWLPAYKGTETRTMFMADASDPVLLPKAGNQYFKCTTGSWWRGMNKPQLDHLVVEAGTYSVSLFVGDADTNVLFYSTSKDPVSGNHVGLTATDPAASVLPDMNSTVNSLLHTLDTNVVVTFDVAAVPGDGEWVQWTIDYVVPGNSPMIGRQLGFLFRKPSATDPQTTAAFDGPLIIDFVPASPKTEPPVAVQYSMAGSTATPGDDYNALPADLLGTNSIVPVTDLVAEGTEHIAINLEASTNYYIAGAGNGSIAIIDHPMDAWREEVFGANSTNPAIAGDSANPDGDRHNNELEWALVTDPMVVDVPAMNPMVNDPYFILSYDRRMDSGYTVRASWSYSLANPVWRTDGGMQEILVGQNGDVQTIAVLIPLEGLKKFVRLEAGD